MYMWLINGLFYYVYFIRFWVEFQSKTVHVVASYLEMKILLKIITQIKCRFWLAEMLLPQSSLSNFYSIVPAHTKARVQRNYSENAHA